jgi:hypothetical protein
MKFPNPVAEVQIENDYWKCGHFFEGSRKCLYPITDLECLSIGTRLYTEDQLFTVRRAALEEAAKVCYDVAHEYGEGWGDAVFFTARLIRSLIKKELE